MDAGHDAAVGITLTELVKLKTVPELELESEPDIAELDEISEEVSMLFAPELLRLAVVLLGGPLWTAALLLVDAMSEELDVAFDPVVPEAVALTPPMMVGLAVPSTGECLR